MIKEKSYFVHYRARVQHNDPSTIKCINKYHGLDTVERDLWNICAVTQAGGVELTMCSPPAPSPKEDGITHVTPRSNTRQKHEKRTTRSKQRDPRGEYIKAGENVTLQYLQQLVSTVKHHSVQWDWARIQSGNTPPPPGRSKGQHEYTDVSPFPLS